MNDAEILKSKLSYSPETGVFQWLVGNGKRVKVGDIAGSLNLGYVRIHVLGKQYPAQRLAWLYMTGEWPEKQIDHINMVRSDNRWANLRLATRSENKTNQRLRPDNTSGFKGVSYFNGKWKATCTVAKKHHYLGLFATAEEAHAVRSKFALKHQGQFYRH